MQQHMLDVKILSPLACHALLVFIKQWQDKNQANEEELLELLDYNNNDSSYLCAENRPDLVKIISDSEAAEGLLYTDDDAFISILDGFDRLFLDEFESMQKRLRAIYDNGHTITSFNDELNKLLNENEDLLKRLEDNV